MTRPHPAHDAVAALTRRQKTTIHITPTVRYRATAPCLLAQLRAELAASTTGTGGRTIPTSRPPIATDVLDLWTEITWTVHSWAHHLNLDRQPYLADDDGHPIPPAGRLLRHVAATATGRGLDDIADAIHHAAQRWRTQIEAMLHGRVEQRGIRAATCPACSATTVRETRQDEVVEGRPGSGVYTVPAVVLVDREIAGEHLRWLTCLACGWSRNLEHLQQLEGAAA
ncbi:MAG TPA: hypothetical protein VKZ67_00970 [Natronosporangium sp.]|nr:hypothetical protein [Natronosporangium sp.]